MTACQDRSCCHYCVWWMFYQADEITVFSGSPIARRKEHVHTYKVIMGFSVSFWNCFVSQGLSVNVGQGWNLSSSPMDDDGGDYSTDKISAQLITKEAPAFTEPERKLLLVTKKKVAHCCTENTIQKDNPLIFCHGCSSHGFELYRKYLWYFFVFRLGGLIQCFSILILLQSHSIKVPLNQ